ncbi:hypothetical protein NQ036_10740 [Brevibacterium sp. 91QC2O2]|uniref:hypothetical protein n=1 Tax=Brevibacterium TaxID=1696 RepID=UPI00211CB961|nr:MULTISPECIES: hypothetical protein [unclassified Brevibacterium]MCQ9368712.1 hypothetical protein [Brevibacterium sp. 91QC2O2]MCQ9386960.1 hypothetical protein [Brevibacterium sp. 68QC2CO]
MTCEDLAHFPTVIPDDWPVYRLGGAAHYAPGPDGRPQRVSPPRSRDCNEYWKSFNPAEAAAWIEACYAFRSAPTRPTILALSLSSLRDGGLPTIGDSPETVEAARAIGFTPTALSVLGGALAEISPQEHPHHPRNYGGDRRYGVPGQPFDPSQWDGWVNRVLGGTHPLIATKRHLRKRPFTLSGERRAA